MRYYIGLDIGSTSSELVVLNESKKIVYLCGCTTGADIRITADDLINEAKNNLNCSMSDFPKMVITGYGRKLLQFSKIMKYEVTEISCYAKGALWLNPDVRTIVDIGGQDSKVIAANSDGGIDNFAMNDKCAAGTGKFLEIIANQFNISLQQLSDYSKDSTQNLQMSNICAVFAQSEIVNLVSRGHQLADIIKSVEVSIISRIGGLIDRVGKKEVVMFCGGVAQNVGIVRELEKKVNSQLYLPEHVEYVGAIGAALFAIERE